MKYEGVGYDWQALEDILSGATLLASGGGGPYSGGKLLLEHLLTIAESVSAIQPADVAADAMLAMVAGIGSPDVASHLQDPFTKAPRRAFELLQQAVNTRFGYVVAAEIGAMNSFIPMLVATQLKLPVIDADSAGRAIPELSMSTFADNIPIEPLAIANENDAPIPAISAIVNTAAPNDMETIVGGIIGASSFGHVGGFAAWAMNGAQLQEYSIPGGLERSRRIGCVIREAKAIGIDPVQAVLDLLGDRACVLYRGKIAQSDEQLSGSLDLGRVVLQGTDGSQAWVYNLNENLIAWTTASVLPLAMGPDSICYITTDGQTFSNADIDDEIRAKDVVLIGLRAHDKMRAAHIIAQFLEVFRTIGYAGPYIPIEELSSL